MKDEVKQRDLLSRRTDSGRSNIERREGSLVSYVPNRHYDALNIFGERIEQIVGRERRGRVSHHNWFGDA